MPKDESIAGTLPHFVVAKNKIGYWSCYRLTTEGFERLTLSAFSPADAARHLEAYFAAHPEVSDELEPQV